MSSLSKLAIGVIGTGTASAAVFISGSSSNLSIPWISLKKENTHTESTKVGGAFGSFLVGVYGEEENKNEEWWKYSYSLYLKDQGEVGKFSDEFKKEKIKDAFTAKGEIVETTSEAKSLNLVCKGIYEQKKDKVMVPKEENKHQNFELRRDFWKYCSPIELTPQTIKDHNGSYEEGTIGKTKELELLSVWEQDVLWSIKENSFFQQEENSINSLMFKNFRSDKKKGESLRKVCALAYQKKSDTGGDTDATKISEDEVVKYCSLEDK